MNIFELSQLYLKETNSVVGMITKATAGAYSIMEHNSKTIAHTSDQLYHHTKELVDAQNAICQYLFEQCSFTV